MENLTITLEERKILELTLATTEEQRDALFKVFYPLASTVFDDEVEQLRVRNGFYNGMMMQLYLQNADQVKAISKDETVLLLQQQVQELQTKLTEEKKLSKETLQKFKDDADVKMRALEEQQDQYYTDLKEEMAKKLKLNGLWMAGGCIAALMALAELIYIVTKL